jgi:hypothetical protein
MFVDPSLYFHGILSGPSLILLSQYPHNGKGFGFISLFSCCDLTDGRKKFHTVNEMTSPRLFGERGFSNADVTFFTRLNFKKKLDLNSAY